MHGRAWSLDKDYLLSLFSLKSISWIIQDIEKDNVRVFIDHVGLYMTSV